MDRPTLVLTLCLTIALSASAWAQPAPGEGIYTKSCAMCHEVKESRAPALDAMKRMSAALILRALENGIMTRESAGLSREQKVAVAEYIAGKPLGDEPDPLARGRCSDSPTSFDFKPDSPHWSGWGADLANTRFQPAAMAGLAAGQLSGLKLKWSFGFEGSRVAYAQPAVAGERLFVGSATRIVYSLNAKSGCVYWAFQAADSVRSAISLGKLASGRWAVFFGDGRTNAYALDAATGKLLWKTTINPGPACRITGAPAFHNGRLYVPTSCPEDGLAMNPKYECCRSRGSVAALDAGTGNIIWHTFTIAEEPKPTKLNSAGTQMWGPSGASVWCAVTLDPERKALYVGTSNNHSNPPTATSDAVLAFDMDSGKVLWSTQLTPGGDAWNMACGAPNKANCPENEGPDFDVGSAPILRVSGGKRYILVGQKSAMVSALDPDAKGKVLWQTRIGKGGKLGGIEWGMAADTNNVYVPLSDFGPNQGGGLFGIRIRDGEKIWYTPPAPCGDRTPCLQAQMAATTAIPGVVFSGSLDGFLRAYSSADGKVVWEYDTIRDFDTVNGLKGRGGSLNGPGPIVVGGILYVNSGYGMWGGRPGNVLLAFEATGAQR